MGENNLRKFLSGEEFIITGRLFDYCVSKTHDIFQHTMYPHIGHIPYALCVLDKKGQRLGRVCVLFDSTPVLDQLVALHMFISSGEEETLIEKANIFDRSAYFNINPEMKRIKGNVNSSNDIGDILGAMTHPYGSCARFNEEIIPWRPRLRQPILGVLSEMVEVPINIINALADTERNIRNIVHKSSIARQNIFELIEELV